MSFNCIEIATWRGPRAAVRLGGGLNERVYGLNLEDGTAFELGLVATEVSRMPSCWDRETAEYEAGNRLRVLGSSSLRNLVFDIRVPSERWERETAHAQSAGLVRRRHG